MNGRAIAVAISLSSVVACSASEPVVTETLAVRTTPPPAPPPADDARYDELVEEGGRLFAAKETARAQELFVEAHALSPERVEARYGLGVVHAAHCWADGRACDACIDKMSDVIARGGFRHSHFNRAQCHFVLGKYELALADYSAALAAAPDDLDALEGHGLTLLMLRRRPEGCEDLARLKKLGRDPEKAVNELCPGLGPPSKCATERWGGWDGTPECARTAAREAPGAHRECTADADCVRLGNDCNPHAVNRASAEVYSRIPLQCTNPAAGPCTPPRATRCEAGCCVVDR